MVGAESPVPRVETWFGYWRDDGFVLKKGKRVERRPGVWEEIKTSWLDGYFNQRVIPGRSCKVAVTSTDEWVAEAYLDADYTSLTKEDYERDVKRYMLFNLMLDTHLGFDEAVDEAQ
jgi:hypothetical protein